MKQAWVWIVRAALGGAAVYLLGTALFLNAFLPRLINTDPEKLEVRYDYAYSLFPGTARAHRVQVRITDKNVKMHFVLQDVSVGVELSALRERIFRTTYVEGVGLDFRLRRHHDENPDDPALPEIPLPRTPQPPPSPETGEKKPPFRVRLAGVDVRGLRELWIEEYRFLGQGHVTGGFQLDPGKYLSVDQGKLRIHLGKVTLGKLPVADAVHADIAATIHPHFRERFPDMHLFENLDASVVGQADIVGVEFLNHYLRQMRDIQLQGGRGPMQVDLHVLGGTLQKESRLAIEAKALRAKLWKHLAEGDGRIRWAIQSSKKGEVGRLHVDFSRYDLKRDANHRSHIYGKHLTLAADSRDLSLVRPFQDIDLRLEVPRAKISDLTYFNAYLPRTGPEILGGSGLIQGKLATSSRRGTHDTGELSLTTQAAQVRYGQSRFTGDLQLIARTQASNIKDGVLDISGSHVNLDKVEARLEAGTETRFPQWWGALQCAHCELRITDPVAFKGDLDIEGRDARPVIAVFAKKSGIPGIVQRLLAFRGLRASLSLEANDKKLELKNAKARGAGSALEAWFLKSGDFRQGRLLMQYGPFAAGLEIQGDRTRLKLNDAIGWFRGKKEAE